MTKAAAVPPPELELASLLRGRFPHDLIEPVAKGEFGGDLLPKR
jgi:hypothetical protein